tara:strand:+ start:478 stop:792 length:315 start_codon:yes stop_codon:yes gene_type:complete
MSEFSRRDHDIEYWGAVEQSDGSYLDKYGAINWYNEAGHVHREDGPAIYYPHTDVVRYWWVYGERCSTLDKYWYLNGVGYTFDKWCIFARIADDAKMMIRLQYE